MPKSNSVNIHKLQQALNSKGYKILCGTTQFWSEKENRPIKLYKVEQVIDGEGKKAKREKLFESTSQIQIVLFLRDLWNEVNGFPEDTSNEYWNEIKRKKINE